jgi:hypothetical protein
MVIIHLSLAKSIIEDKKEILEADPSYDSEGVDFQAEIIWK